MWLIDELEHCYIPWPHATSLTELWHRRVTVQQTFGCGALTTCNQPREVTQTLFAPQHIPDLMIETYSFLQESGDPGHSWSANRMPITVQPQPQPKLRMSSGIRSLEVIHEWWWWMHFEQTNYSLNETYEFYVILQLEWVLITSSQFGPSTLQSVCYADDTSQLSQCRGSNTNEVIHC